MFDKIREYFEARRAEKALLEAQQRDALAAILKEQDENIERLKSKAREHTKEAITTLESKGWIIIPKFMCTQVGLDTIIMSAHTTSPEKQLYKLKVWDSGGYELEVVK